MIQKHKPAYLRALYNLRIIEPCSICDTHTFSSDRMTGGSIVGDMAPYQAFAVGGLGSVRGYSEGAVGSTRTRWWKVLFSWTLELIWGLLIMSLAVSSNFTWLYFNALTSLWVLKFPRSY